MTNKDLITLNQILEQMNDVKGKKFAYAVLKNQSIIQKEIEYFEKLRQKEIHPNFQEYEEKRKNLCELHSRKNENGEAITYQNQYDIEDLDKFQTEFEDLKSEYPEVVEAVEQHRKEYEDFLNQESEVELVKVSLEEIPEEVDANILKYLQFIIKE